MLLKIILRKGDYMHEYAFYNALGWACCMCACCVWTQISTFGTYHLCMLMNQLNKID